MDLNKVAATDGRELSEVLDPGDGCVREVKDVSVKEDEPEIDIVINNVVCSFSVRCHLNLRQIALNGINVEYRREQGVSKHFLFNLILMCIRDKTFIYYPHSPEHNVQVLHVVFFCHVQPSTKNIIFTSMFHKEMEVWSWRKKSCSR